MPHEAEESGEVESTARAERANLRVIWVIHAVTFAFFFSLGLTIPVLPLYLTELGIGPAWIGWAVGLMPLAGIVLRPWGGWASDGWSRKWPMVIGFAVSVLAGVAYLGPLSLVLVGRLMQGAGIALFAPASLAVTSDLAPEERLGSIMATRNLLVGIGIMAGAGAGGVLVDLVGFAGVFWAVALVQLPFLPLLLRCPETLDTPVRRRWWQGYAAALAIPAILAATIGNGGFSASFAALQAYYPLVLTGAGFSAALVGAFFGFYSFVSVLARIPAGGLIGRFGAERVALWGYAFAVVGLFGLYFAPVPPLAFVSGVLLGVGGGFYLPANLVAVSRAAPKEMRGSAFSLYTVSWDVGGLVGPVVGGAIAATAGVNSVLLFSACFAVFVLFGYVRLVGRRALHLERRRTGERAGERTGESSAD